MALVPAVNSLSYFLLLCFISMVTLLKSFHSKEANYKYTYTNYDTKTSMLLEDPDRTGMNFPNKCRLPIILVIILNI